MKRGRRILLLLMTLMLVMGPAASAQSTPEMQPGDAAETATVETDGATEDATPEGEGSDVDEPGDTGTGEPEATDADSPSEDAVDPDGQPASRQAAPDEVADPAGDPAGDMQVMAVGDATLTVTVVGSDPGYPVPTGAFVCVSVIWDCAVWTGAPLTFTVPAGTYTISFDMFDESYYTDTNTTVTVAADELRDVVLTLEPRQPSTLRLYVSTDTGAPVPAGTEACVQQDATDYTEAVDECQPVSGLYVDFGVNEGWVDVTVTTPVDSGFSSVGERVWVPGGTVYRDYFVLEDDADGFVTIDVSTEDGLPLAGIPVLCFQHATQDLEQCSWVGVPIFDGDGGGNYTFHVPAGDWTWLVEPSVLDSKYLPVSGTVTVADNDDLVVNAMLPLRTEADVASLTVHVSTFDGGAVPAGTQVCTSDAVLDDCVEWTGGPVVIDVAAGAVWVQVLPPDDSDYLAFSLFLPFVQTGDARMVDAVLYPLDTELTIVKTVSDEAPEAGDTVAYTIHAFGPAFEFLIEDVLPAGLTDISVTCAGSFISELPGWCYEIVDGIVVVPGIAGNEAFLDVTLTITGTVTGTPGTTVTNVACVTSFVWTGDEVDCASADFVIAESVEPGPSPDPDPAPGPKPQPQPQPKPDDSKPAPKPEKPGKQDVTKLPSTGAGGAGATSMALYASLVSALMLAGAGALRLRDISRR